MSVYSGTYEQSSSPDGRPGRGRRRCGSAAWKPIEIIAMVLGFIVFWPIGLAILLAKIWQRRSDDNGDLPSFIQSKWEEKVGRHWACHGHFRDFSDRQWGFRGGMRSTGNLAFDDWREAELARLEEERQKLLAAEREFVEFMENLRRAKDREEFDRFMNARRNGGPSTPPQA
ncbi:MAG: DUF2852 domain-containing protein [Beijerinckiaceae bacterium]